MTTPPALLTLFNNIISGVNPAIYAYDLYSITLFNGSVLRFTTADFDIRSTINQGTGSPSGPFTFPSTGLRIDQKESKVQAHWKIGTDTDTLTVVVMPRSVDLVTGATFPDKIGGVPWLQAASAGALDGADFQVDRAYFATLPTWPMPPTGAVPTGAKTIFAGTVAEVDTTGTIAALTVNDYRVLLTTQMPRHLYQAQCRHTLFDAGCTLPQSGYPIAGSCAAGSTRQNIVAPGLRPPSNSAGTFALGQIIFTSGQNNTFFSMVKTWDGTNFALFYPMPFTPAPGDTFNVYPGCNKTLTACTAFSNQINFGGQPYIPPPETAG